MCLITRVRSIAQEHNNQASYKGDFKGVQSNGNSGAMLAALEMLMRGNWSAITGISDMSEDALERRKGYSKIIQSAREAKKLGFQWIWIDVCLPLPARRATHSRQLH